jgi:hypothetical protein
MIALNVFYGTYRVQVYRFDDATCTVPSHVTWNVQVSSTARR